MSGLKKTQQVNSYQHGSRFSFLPFDLPEGKSGNWEITKTIAPKGTSLTVVSLRNAIFMGLEPAKAVLQEDTEIHNLAEHEVSEAWMTTRPQEQEQHTRQLAKAHGNVLVGGLGLGMAVGILAANKKVRKITVVEKSPDVIALVEPHLNGRCKIIEDDLFDHLAKCKQLGYTYGFAFYDIWCPTGQYAYTEYVLPLRQASIKVVPQEKIECWNEDEMLGQIAMSINNWVGPEREVIRKMMNAQWNPWDKSPQEFRGIRGGMREIYPFLAWMHSEKPPAEYAQLKSRWFMSSLKDAVMYNRDWKAWDNYGLDDNKK